MPDYFLCGPNPRASIWKLLMFFLVYKFGRIPLYRSRSGRLSALLGSNLQPP